MTKERAWPVKAMYILIAAALAISLIIIAAPAHRVSAADVVDAEWERVSTPTTDGWVLAPETMITDWAVADGGDVAYAIVDGWNEEEAAYGSWLLKSDDGAATWDDITDALDEVIDPDDLDLNQIDQLMRVETDGVDSEFVAVALWWWDDGASRDYMHVFISDDGGSTFEDASEVEDGGVSFGDYNTSYGEVFDLAVSPEVDDERDIAIGGYDDNGDAAIFRCTATGDSATAWEDAAAYDGWCDEGEPSAFTSIGVTDIQFAPSWAADNTILVVTVDWSLGMGPFDIHLQSGTWGTTEGWNADSNLAIDAVAVIKDTFICPLGRLTAGVTLPMDYSGRNSDKRYAWVWVNVHDGISAWGEIFRVKNTSVMSINQQIEDMPLLTNVNYLGYIAEGKAVAGVLGNGEWPSFDADCCDGVQVYRNDQIAQMDICCLPWDLACKPPTGTGPMEAFYVSADKAYAVALFDFTDYDESAWSVSFDDGDTWNQLSLVDTYIDFFSDVAVSPDCNKTWVVSVNEGTGCGCDSVWLYGEDLPEYGYSEYSGYWIRVWCGALEGYDYDRYEHGILRLNPEETTGDTVYLADVGNDNVYWNEMEGLACWDFGSASVDNIADLAVLDEETIYALDYDGTVAMSDDYAIGWHEPEDSEVADGWTIAVWGDYVLVGGMDGDVCYSDDGGETFTELEDVATGGYVTVAFDTYFDTNKVIYAALDSAPGTENGIYRWAIGKSTDWMDLKAEPLESQLAVNDGDLIDERVEVNFTGLVVDSPSNTYTDDENGGVIYASYYGHVTANMTDIWFTGVARSLERVVEVCTTCLTWDFLWVGLTVNVEGFEAWPDAVKICGCLTSDTNSKLFAIDYWDYYDMVDNEAGSVWTFEDCYAKKAPETTTPDVEADPCSCYSRPFTLLWDSLCDACVYEIQFALDKDFTMPVQVNEEGEPETNYIIEGITGDNPSYSVMGGQAGGLSCETTYYWRVRASEAATGQVIHSWWTVGESFTVPPSKQGGYSDITLVAPAPGALNQPTKNVGFSWDILADADEFKWVLSENSNLSPDKETKTKLTSKACTYTGTLAYGTTYYWQVTAYADGEVISVSAVGTFTTAAQGAFCCPQCGLCFDTEAELQAHIDELHPAQPATPFWVWIVIGIGAVLVIVVIVLIFRTRRV